MAKLGKDWQALVKLGTAWLRLTIAWPKLGQAWQSLAKACESLADAWEKLGQGLANGGMGFCGRRVTQRVPICGQGAPGGVWTGNVSLRNLSRAVLPFAIVSYWHVACPYVLYSSQHV